MLEEKCAYCGDMTDMPFECNYCKDPFCAEHRLPEDHRCVNLLNSGQKDLEKNEKLFVMVELEKRVNFVKCLVGLAS